MPSLDFSEKAAPYSTCSNCDRNATFLSFLYGQERLSWALETQTF